MTPDLFDDIHDRIAPKKAPDENRPLQTETCNLWSKVVKLHISELVSDSQSIKNVHQRD